MSTRTFRPLTLIVAIVASTSLLLLPAATARAAGNSILVTIEATKQGKLKSDDKSGKIAVTAFSRETKSPRDAATGQASGRVQNLPVTITKAIDAASPQLLQAMATNEVLKTVTIEFYAPTPDGVQALTQTIKLTNAGVAGLRQYIDAGDDANTAAPGIDVREDVSLSYQTLEFVGEGAVAEVPSKPAAKPLDPAAPLPGAPSAGAAPAPAPTLTRTARPAPGATISPKMTTPTELTAPKLAPAADTPAPAPAPTATAAPTAATAPTLTRAQRARRAAAAATMPTSTTAPTAAAEVKPDPATKPAAEQPVAPAPAPVPRKRR